MTNQIAIKYKTWWAGSVALTGACDLLHPFVEIFTGINILALYALIGALVALAGFLTSLVGKTEKPFGLAKLRFAALSVAAFAGGFLGLNNLSGQPSPLGAIGGAVPGIGSFQEEILAKLGSIERNVDTLRQNLIDTPVLVSEAYVWEIPGPHGRAKELNVRLFSQSPSVTYIADQVTVIAHFNSGKKETYIYKNEIIAPGNTNELSWGDLPGFPKKLEYCIHYRSNDDRIQKIERREFLPKKNLAGTLIFDVTRITEGPKVTDEKCL